MNTTILRASSIMLALAVTASMTGCATVASPVPAGVTLQSNGMATE